MLSFEIENIFEQIRDLAGPGVSFLHNNLPELKTTNYVAVMDAEKAAWFADNGRAPSSACTRTRTQPRCAEECAKLDSVRTSQWTSTETF